MRRMRLHPPGGVMTDTEFRIPDAWCEPPLETDEEPAVAWHQLPACVLCEGSGERLVRGTLRTIEAWTECPACGGAGYIDPEEAT